MIPYLDRADNGRFHIVFSAGGRSHRKSTGTDDETSALKSFAKWILDEKEQPAGANVIFGDIWPAYEDSHRGKPTGVRLRGMAPRLDIFFGGIPVQHLSQEHLDSYVDLRTQDGAKPGTIRLELTKVIAAINFAVRRKAIPAEIVPDLELPEPPESKDRWLSRQEAAKLVKAAEAQRGEDGRMSRAERFLWIALSTGARRRAIETLTWDRVDFETGVIHLHRPGDQRTSKRKPSVPMSDTLRGALATAYRERTNNYVLDTPGEVYTAVVRAAAAAGVQGVTPHVLRHTAATWMARKGVPLWQIAGILGNSLAVVEQVYAKHCPQALKAAVDTMFDDMTPSDT